jgi:hypothetical protein
VTIDLRWMRSLWPLLALVPLLAAGLLIAKGEGTDAARVGGLSARARPSVPASIGDPTKVTAAQSMFREVNFRRALGALRKRIPARQKLLRVELRPYVAEFHLREGDGASGFSWLAKERRLRPIQVRVVGTGSLDGEQFAEEVVRADSPARVGARLRDEDERLGLSVMSLERVAPDGFLQWSVLAESAGRSATYFANPDGRGLEDPSRFTQDRLGGG